MNYKQFFRMLDEIHELNDLQFTNGLLMLPFVRYQILHQIINEAEKCVSPYKRAKRNKISLRYLIITLFLNPFRVKKKDILIFSTTRANNEKKSGKYFNRLHDYFGELFEEETAIIERSFNFEYRRPRYFSHVHYDDIIIILSRLWAKLHKIPKKDIIRIYQFVQILRDKFSYGFKEEFYDFIRSRLLEESVRSICYYRLAKYLLKKARPKIIFINAASYGFEAPLVKAAKDLGIYVGEFQHGIIGMNHPAYSYFVLANSQYKEYLPDFFFSYGDYWTEIMNMPSRVVTVGSPHFNEKQLSSKQETKGQRKKRILFISDGYLSELYTRLILELLALIDNERYEIVLRLHPVEIEAYIEKYNELLMFKNVEIETQGEIYASLEYSDVVVGCYSFVLYEAAAMKKFVCVLENNLSKNYISEDVGYFFRSAIDLNKILEEKKEAKRLDVSYYWHKNWQMSYSNAIKRILSSRS